jgi:hypothetical protein
MVRVSLFVAINYNARDKKPDFIFLPASAPDNREEEMS